MWGVFGAGVLRDVVQCGVILGLCLGGVVFSGAARDWDVFVPSVFLR